MARIPYADVNNSPERLLIDQIVAQRGSVLHLYQILLHSPALTEGWLNFLSAVRQRSTLPGPIRELIIMRVAILNGATYEASQHAAIALAEGLSQKQLDALSNWHEAENEFTFEQQSVLALTDAMTQEVQVPEAIWMPIRTLYDERKIVEVVATISAYNMVSRFLEALEIHTDDKREAH